MSLGPISNATANQKILFRRAYTVSVGQPTFSGTGPLVSFQNAFVGGNAIQYGTTGKNPAPLRVSFDVDKVSSGTNNEAKIQIYNLAIETRQAIKKGWLVELQAGYKGLTQQQGILDLLFLGNVVTPESTRNGPDIVTTLKCIDGGSSLALTTFDRSYPPGSTLAQMLQDVAETLHLTGVNAGTAIGIPVVIYNNGQSLHGAAKDSLDLLCKGQGLEWHIDNGSLNILPITGSNQETAQVVSLNTGMIGVPSDNNQFMQFTSLLNPKLVPGSPIKLVSENEALNGLYRIRRSHFEGDSHDAKWQVTCECLPLPNAAEVFPVSSGFKYTQLLQ